MSVLNVRTKGSTLIVEKASRITSGGRNAVKLRVVFDEAWECKDGKYSASFYVNDPEDACTVELTRNNDGSYGCNIPSEVILDEGYFNFGVWCESDDMLKPSDIKLIRVYRGIVTNGRSGESEIEKAVNSAKEEYRADLETSIETATGENYDGKTWDELNAVVTDFALVGNLADESGVIEYDNSFR